MINDEKVKQSFRGFIDSDEMMVMVIYVSIQFKPETNKSGQISATIAKPKTTKLKGRRHFPGGKICNPKKILGPLLFAQQLLKW